MPKYMDIHQGFVGVTREQLEAAHAQDLQIQGEEGVRFEQAWLDPAVGKVFCLSTWPEQGGGHAHPRASRPPDHRDLRVQRRARLTGTGRRPPVRAP